MASHTKDQRRHKLFDKLHNDPTTIKTNIRTLFKKGHWEGALKSLDRFVARMISEI